MYESAIQLMISPQINKKKTNNNNNDNNYNNGLFNAIEVIH